MNTHSTSSSGGIGLGGALTLVFIVLKLVGVINWSWVWVLSPIWIALVIAGITILVLRIILHKSGIKKRSRR